MTGTVEVFSDTGGAAPAEGYRFEGTHPTVHGRTRAAALYQVALPMMQRGLPLVVVQTGAVYGPGDDSDLGRMMRSYLLGRVPFVPTRTAYCWAHAEDVAAGHLLAMEDGEIGRIYLMCGEAATLLDVMRLAGSLVGRRRGPVPVPGRTLRPVAAVLGVLGAVIPALGGTSQWLRHLAGHTYLGDDRRAGHELGWRRRTIEDGIPDAVRALLQDLFEKD
jgi:nucleoside-diphosphate-sugar epimerase